MAPFATAGIMYRLMSHIGSNEEWSRRSLQHELYVGHRPAETALLCSFFGNNYWICHGSHGVNLIMSQCHLSVSHPSAACCEVASSRSSKVLVPNSDFIQINFKGSKLSQVSSKVPCYALMRALLHVLVLRTHESNRSINVLVWVCVGKRLTLEWANDWLTDLLNCSRTEKWDILANFRIQHLSDLQSTPPVTFLTAGCLHIGQMELTNFSFLR